MPDRLRTVIAEALAAELSTVDGPYCVWMDGTEGSLALASTARVKSYADDGAWNSAASCAMSGCFPLDHVYVGQPHALVTEDLAEMLGTEPSPRTYAFMLVCMKALADGFTRIVTPTGAEAAYGTSQRIRAAYDDLDDVLEFDVRRSLWGVAGPLKRYEKLVGHTVTALEREKPRDIIQWAEFEEVLRESTTECRLASTLGIRLWQPFLSPRLSGDVMALPSSLRY